MLSVITYNILHGKHLNQVTSWLHSHIREFDIICLQEFPYAAISDFLKTFHPLKLQYGFSPGFMSKFGTFGQLTVYTPKVRLLSENVISLGEYSFLENTLFMNKDSRTSLVTVFAYKKEKITIANTHLICLALNKKRISQMRRLIKYLDDITDGTHATVILGDFNYSSLIRQSVLLELMKSEHFKNAFIQPTHKLLFLHQQLDYIFYRGCTVENIEIEQLKYSDHYPVKFTLKV